MQLSSFFKWKSVTTCYLRSQTGQLWRICSTFCCENPIFSHRKANQSGIVWAHFLNNSKWKTEMATAKAGSHSTRIGCCDSFPSATTVPLKLRWGRVRKASKSTITYYLIHYKFNERAEDERIHAAHMNEIWNFQVVCTDFKSMPKTLLYWFPHVKCWRYTILWNSNYFAWNRMWHAASALIDAS